MKGKKLPTDRPLTPISAAPVLLSRSNPSPTPTSRREEIPRRNFSQANPKSYCVCVSQPKVYEIRYVLEELLPHYAVFPPYGWNSNPRTTFSLSTPLQYVYCKDNSMKVRGASVLWLHYLAYNCVFDVIVH